MSYELWVIDHESCTASFHERGERTSSAHVDPASPVEALGTETLGAGRPKADNATVADSVVDDTAAQPIISDSDGLLMH